MTDNIEKVLEKETDTVNNEEKEINPVPEITEEKAGDTAEKPEKKEEKSKKQTFDNFRDKITPLSCFLFILCFILIFLLGFQTARVGKVSSELSDMNEIRSAVYDKSQKIEVAGKADRIQEYHYSLGEIAIPALEGVPVSKYKEENFGEDENGYLCYYRNGEVSSYVGIDVSAHNGDIDFERVKAAGVDFVMLRIGGRGYGQEGVLYYDSSFTMNLRNAKKAGLMVGAYFFSQAVTPKEAREEALYALDILDGKKLDYPLAFDWEIIDTEDARTDKINPQTLTECARVFCDTVKEEGYTPCIYTGSTLAYYKYDLAQLSDIDIWYAFYNDSPDMYYNYMMWQYSCTGKVDGVEGDVDLNICFKNYK